MINMIQKYQQRRLLFDEKTLLPKLETLRVDAIPLSERTDHQKRDSIGRFERALRTVGYPCNTYLANLTPTNWVAQARLYRADTHWGMPLIMRDITLVHTEPIPRPRISASPCPALVVKQKKSRPAGAPAWPDPAAVPKLPGGYPNRNPGGSVTLPPRGFYPHPDWAQE